MNVDKTEKLSIDIHISPHSAIIRLLKFNVLRGYDREAAEYHHITLAHCHIREIFLITVRYFLVTTDVVILLQAEYINALSPHLGKYVHCNEPRCLSIESSHIVSSNL